MKTAIIILNYNSENDTIRFVNEIKEYKNINTIVIVDNCSENVDKLKVLENGKVHVIKSDKNGGYSYGNNKGIKYLNSLGEHYDYIIISNPDVSIEESSIDKVLITLQENEQIAVAVPRMVNAQNKPIRRSSWKIRTPIIDMVNSTRITEFLFYNVFKNRGIFGRRF